VRNGDASIGRTGWHADPAMMVGCPLDSVVPAAA